jgi:hypothetical protein
MRAAPAIAGLLAFGLFCGCGRSKSGSEQAAVPPGSTPPREWSVEPGQRVGLLEASGSEVDLAQHYGAANVGQATIDMGEGEMATGSVLFAPDSLKRIHIIWKDAEGKRLPDMAILRGHRSMWTFPAGVSLGTSLRELEQRNGRPFILLGFGWDMEGFVKSWDGGRLDTSLTGRVKVYLAPDPALRASPDYAAVQGDREYLSNSPTMERLNPAVYQIIADFHPPLTPADTAGARAYRIGEEDSGKEFSYAVSSRFTVILDERKHPQTSLAPKPAGIIGRVQNIPSVEPPLYAASFEAVRPGRCLLTAKDFRVMIEVTEK